MYPRLKELRERLGLTQAEFGQSIGIAKSTYNNYETGIRAPKSDFWIAVAQKYNVTIDYLMGFSDDPSPVDGQKEKPAPNEGSGLSPAEESLIRLFRLVPEESQAMVTQMIQAALKSQGLLP